MMNKPITMLQSFQFLINHIFNSHIINFNNPLSADEFQLLETYCLNHLDQSCFHIHNKDECKSPNLTYILSYERNYIIFQNNAVIESVVSIPVVYCKNCNHYHAILPYLFISPHCQYSIPFILCVIFDKKYSNLTVEEISEKYGVSKSTIYRWAVRYSHYLNYYNQHKDKYHMSFFVTLLYLYEDILNDIFDKCAYAFFQHDCKLFTSSKNVRTSITSIK